MWLCFHWLCIDPSPRAHEPLQQALASFPPISALSSVSGPCTATQANTGVPSVILSHLIGVLMLAPLSTQSLTSPGALKVGSRLASLTPLWPSCRPVPPT